MAIGLGVEGRRRAISGGLLGSDLYVGLHTADPTESSPSELSASGYSRQSVASTGWTIDANGNASNTDAIAFGTAGSAWGNVTHVGFWSAATGGQLVFDQTLTAARDIVQDDVVQFSPGAITVTFAVANT